MKNIKIAFIDLDGTLLNEHGGISLATRESIDALINNGIVIVLASARMPESVISIKNDLSLTTPIICYNGSLIIDANGKTVFTEFIPRTDIVEVVKHTRQQGCINYYYGDCWRVNKYNHWAKHEQLMVGIEPKIATDEEMSSISSGNILVNKILYQDDDGYLLELKDAMSQTTDTILLDMSKRNYLEITPVGASKANATKAVCDMLGFSSDEAIAFGDNYNDVGMLQFVKTSVAMGNAPDIVKAQATHIADTNENDGLAKMIRLIFR